MPWDPSHTVTLAYSENTKPSSSQLPELIRSLAQCQIRREGSCECDDSKCMEVAAQTHAAFKHLPCVPAGEAWLRAFNVLNEQKATTNFSDRIYAIDQWTKTHPELAFMLEYRSVDDEGVRGGRYWYANGSLVAKQIGSPQIVWGERELIATPNGPTTHAVAAAAADANAATVTSATHDHATSAAPNPTEVPTCRRQWIPISSTNTTCGPLSKEIIDLFSSNAAEDGSDSELQEQFPLPPLH